MSLIHSSGFVVLDAEFFGVDQDSWLECPIADAKAELSSSAHDPFQFNAILIVPETDIGRLC